MKYLALILLSIPFYGFNQTENTNSQTITFDNFQYSNVSQGRYGNMDTDFLHGIAEMMKENTSLQLTIEAHFDTRGSKDRAREDSKDQADMMRDFLIETGVEASRIQANGFGEDRPIYSATEINQTRKTNPEKCTEMHAANRRANFRFTKI